MKTECTSLTSGVVFMWKWGFSEVKKVGLSTLILTPSDFISFERSLCVWGSNRHPRDLTESGPQCRKGIKMEAGEKSHTLWTLAGGVVW